MARSRKPRKAAAKPMRYVRGADFRAQRHAIAPAVAYSIPEATLLGQFVEAAYAMYAAHPDTLTPPPSTNFPNGYRLLAGIGMRDFIFASTDHVFYGFVAQSTSAENEFVVAIRGTQGGIEWWDDLNAIVLTPFRVPGCGKVGAGFARVYDTIELAPYASAPSANAPSAERTPRLSGSLSQQIETIVSSHLSARTKGRAATPAPSVSVAGHSLGSALASLYVLENAKTKRLQTPMVCTFASPRVGDAGFVAAFNGLGLTSWRFANGPDIVPQLPPEFLGFRHVSALIPLSSTGKVQPTFACWHALTTYLSLINPALQPGGECALTTARAPLTPSAKARSAIPDWSLNSGLK